jgi:hypothetical protein
LIEYHAPWTQAEVVPAGSVDWIMSQAVLEHVEDLVNLYECMRQWVRADGLISHQVDFKAHGTFFKWNGHWTAGSLLWRALRGKRYYLINRMPWSEHRRLLERFRFRIRELQLQKSPSDLHIGKVSKQLRSKIEPDDLEISGAFFIARRQGLASWC